MYYDELKEAAKQPALLTSLTGALNPAAIITALAVGAVGIAIIAVIKALKNCNYSEDDNLLEVECDGEQDFELYNEPFPTFESNGSNTVEKMSDEELHKEMIRQTMSELGKRSAAKRALKQKQI